MWSLLVFFAKSDDFVTSPDRFSLIGDHGKIMKINENQGFQEFGPSRLAEGGGEEVSFNRNVVLRQWHLPKQALWFRQKAPTLCIE